MFFTYTLGREVIMELQFRHRISMTVLICMISFLQVHAVMIRDTIDARRYPYPEFSNNIPSAGERISIQWILGIYPNGCVPIYETRITRTVENGVISYYLNYQEVPVDYVVDTICDQVLTPYGPKFIVGPFESGCDYRIYIDTALIREFSFPKTKYPYAIITPPEPKVGDTVSVQWVLGGDTVNCVPQYTSSIITRKVLDVLPPIFDYDVDYREIEVDYFACIQRPTIYGPTFRIGVVEVGTYVISYKNETLARFTVQPKDVESHVIRAMPEQPTEGDTLKLQLVLGRGSSSCAPTFITEFDSTVEGEGRYLHKLRYTTIENADTVCTMDEREFGPTWTFPGLQPGYHVFLIDDSEYYKVYVGKKRAIPEFSYAKISGTVSEDWQPDDPEDDAARIVPQCTVTVVFNNTISVSPDHLLDIGEAVPPSQVICYTAVTDAGGHYEIDSIPSALLTDRAYLVARKNGMAGFQVLPDELTEKMYLTIVVNSLETFIDSIQMIVPEPSEVVSLLRELGLEKEMSVTTEKAAGVVRASVTAAPGGFYLVNPSVQKITVAAFSINGRMLWSSNAGSLEKGAHRFRLVLIRVRGETFQQSKVLSLRRN